VRSRRAGAGDKDSGFTLIELMISLGLFALIAVAGLALVDGIINVQGRTEKRFDRLADLQRTMFVVSSDVEQIAAGPLSGGGANSPSRAPRRAWAAPAVPLRYGVAGGALVRTVGPAPQLVLAGVANARWRFWDGAGSIAGRSMTKARIAGRARWRWRCRWRARAARPDRCAG
jgi:general secretion pathway protein J